MSGLPPELAKLNNAEKLELSRLLRESVPDEELPVRELLAERLAEYRENPMEGQSLDDFIATDGRTP